MKNKPNEDAKQHRNRMWVRSRYYYKFQRMSAPNANIEPFTRNYKGPFYQRYKKEVKERS